MSVLIYSENTEGKFKKSTFEAVSYASKIADQLGTDLVAVSLGKVDADSLKSLSKYGVSKVLNADSDLYSSFNNQNYAHAVAEAAKSVDAKVVVISNSSNGKGIAPRVAVKLKAGLATGAIELPKTDGDFVVRVKAFSNKAFADVKVKSDIKLITINANAFQAVENAKDASVETVDFGADPNGSKQKVKETIRKTDKVLLPEAELVVSAGRGLKGPENWGMVEELADLLGAATACSKPVSDSGWRPHSEHVGQTGIAVSPNLYIAIGISGAIQHLAGVSSSKTIVVINKDPEAPFFKAADYGIVGDAFEVVPKLIEAVKAYKGEG